MPRLNPPFVSDLPKSRRTIMQPMKWLTAAALALCTFAVGAQAPTPSPATPPPSPQDVATTPTAPASSAPANTHEITKADVDAWLDGYLPYAMAKGDIAGAVVAVVRDGEIVTERGFGYADVATKKPVDPKLTLFRPGSVSKLFTWTAVMQLVEQGKIDLDADVNKYLPEDFQVPPRDGKPVTMRNIMTHTAGYEEQIKNIITENPDTPDYVTLLKRWMPNRI